MIEKTINIEGKDITFRSSALLPKLYRFYLGRDMIQDMQHLIKGWKALNALPEETTEEERDRARLDLLDYEAFTNVAWIMMKHAGEDVGKDPDEWLTNWDGAFSIYQVFPTVMELWAANNQTTAVPKKK